MTTACRSSRCGAPVLFVPSAATGRTMCLDADPSPTGNVWLSHGPDGKAVVLGKDALRALRAGPEARLLHTDHHATCPDAATFRKGRT